MMVDEYGGFEGIITMEDILEIFLRLEIQNETGTHPDMQELAEENGKLE